MSFSIEKPTFSYFKKDKPEWARLGAYMNWLFREHVKGAPGISGTFALKVHDTKDGTMLHADFWAAPLGMGFQESLIERKESKLWIRSVKRMDELRIAAKDYKPNSKRKKK